MIDQLVDQFNQGQLANAIESGNRHVADNPRDLVARLFLLQLVCFTGNWERIGRIVNQLIDLDPENEYAPLTNFVSKLAKAEKQRAAVWEKGILPEFMAKPDELSKKALWALNCRREGEMEKYEEAVEWMNDNAPSIELETQGNTFKGFRDLDDPTAFLLEVLTLNGDYFWVPFSDIQSINVTRPVRPIDHLWTFATIVAGGEESRVYLPNQYFHSYGAEEPDAVKLGRETAWKEDSGVAVGRRIFTADCETEFSLFDLENCSLKVGAGE